MGPRGLLFKRKIALTTLRLEHRRQSNVGINVGQICLISSKPSLRMWEQGVSSCKNLVYNKKSNLWPKIFVFLRCIHEFQSIFSIFGFKIVFIKSSNSLNVYEIEWWIVRTLSLPTHFCPGVGFLPPKCSQNLVIDQNERQNYI